MTEEWTAKKKRPASSGGLSKTHHPVHNEACQNLLREASHQVMREANIPANIWELCKGSGANPRALPCLVTKQRESRVLAQGQTGRVSLTPVPSRYVATTATRSSHLQTQYKEARHRASSPRFPWVHMLVSHPYCLESLLARRMEQKDLSMLAHCLLCLEPLSKWLPLVLSIIFSKNNALHSTGSECIQHCLHRIFLEIGIKQICWVPNLLF